MHDKQLLIKCNNYLNITVNVGNKQMNIYKFTFKNISHIFTTYNDECLPCTFN